MAPDHEIDDLTVRAVHAAVGAAGGIAQPLSNVQTIVIACAAVHRAGLTLDPSMPLAERKAALTEAARSAIALAQSEEESRLMRRAKLVGGIERLPMPQQLVLSLRFEHGLSNAEIAAVLGITDHDVKERTALAFDQLWGET